MYHCHQSSLVPYPQQTNLINRIFAVATSASAQDPLGQGQEWRSRNSEQSSGYPVIGH